MKNIVVAGQGYVGLPLAVEAVKAGYGVVGYDVDEQKIASLQSGNSYIEDISSETISEILRTNRYTPSSQDREMKGFHVAIITVPTPLRDGDPDLSYIQSVAETVGRFLEKGQRQTVVLESTTYPGTTRDVLIPILERVSKLTAGVDFHVGFSPERIDPGNKTWAFRNTPKIVSGLGDECLGKVSEFYSSVCDNVVTAKGLEEAELAKVMENTFRHVNIALVNELAAFADELDIDVWHTLDLAATKPFGYMKFTPGPGVGGHCLPIDPAYLAWHVKKQVGRPFRFVETANEINRAQPRYVVDRLARLLNSRRTSVNGAKVLMYGYAYKKDSSDYRESPAIEIRALLRSLGATVDVVDSCVASQGIEDVQGVIGPDQISQYDVAVIVTDHSDVDYEKVVQNSKLVLDTRNVGCVAGNVELL
ncbi:nucleotide sugar dehydrogenase [Streptomyces sp. NPDC046197]|uniref:nucleotide sugar dehydrogenase n=1 Tax=Streptomyces sp. NPDC046197 TaxID=3154337 RepID=UPI0033E0D1E7